MRQATKDVLTAGWLRTFDRAFSDALLAAGRLIDYSNGETVYGIGDDQTCLYCVVSGAARFEITMNEQPPRFAHLIGPGAWFGENEFAFEKSAILEVTTVCDTTLFCLHNTQLEAIATQYNVVWKAIATLSSMNVAVAVGAADDLMIRSARQRLCAILLRLSAHRNAFQGQPPMKALFLTQVDLASAANLSRSKTAEIIASLVALGAVKTVYGGIEIISADILQAQLP